MNNRWQVPTAQARFDEFLERSLVEGPQIVTRDGVEVAALVAMEEWRRLQRQAGPDLKQLLLSDDARTDDLAPPRRRFRRRPSPDFDPSDLG